MKLHTKAGGIARAVKCNKRNDCYLLVSALHDVLHALLGEGGGGNINDFTGSYLGGDCNELAKKKTLFATRYPSTIIRVD